MLSTYFIENEFQVSNAMMMRTWSVTSTFRFNIFFETTGRPNKLGLNADDFKHALAHGKSIENLKFGDGDGPNLCRVKNRC